MEIERYHSKVHFSHLWWKITQNRVFKWYFPRPNAPSTIVKNCVFTTHDKMSTVKLKFSSWVNKVDCEDLKLLGSLSSLISGENNSFSWKIIALMVFPWCGLHLTEKDSKEWSVLLCTFSSLQELKKSVQLCTGRPEHNRSRQREWFGRWLEF